MAPELANTSDLWWAAGKRKKITGPRRNIRSFSVIDGNVNINKSGNTYELLQEGENMARTGGCELLGQKMIQRSVHRCVLGWFPLCRMPKISTWCFTFRN